jgi:hypothetical protein
MGKSTISMVIFNSYVKLAEGKWMFCSINDINAQKPGRHSIDTIV